LRDRISRNTSWASRSWPLWSNCAAFACGSKSALGSLGGDEGASVLDLPAAPEVGTRSVNTDL